MVKKALKSLLTAFIVSTALLILALAIWWLMKDSGTSLQDVLFCVGALPVALFSISVLGEYFGRGNPSVLFGESVSNRLPGQRALQDVTDLKSGFKSAMNWVAAGLVILLVCYLI